MTDHFALFSIPRTFRDNDAALLERRFHELQRRYHPDHTAGKDKIAISESLDHSSAINQAYRILRDTHSRTKYLLSLYDYNVEQSKQVPMDLLELVMNVQEQVAMLESGSDGSEELFQMQNEIFSRLEALDSQINRFQIEWDSSPDVSHSNAQLSEANKNILEGLTNALASQSYLRTLDATLKAAKEGKSLVLKH